MVDDGGIAASAQVNLLSLAARLENNEANPPTAFREPYTQISRYLYDLRH
jgi:hypothetical protein